MLEFVRVPNNNDGEDLRLSPENRENRQTTGRPERRDYAATNDSFTVIAKLNWPAEDIALVLPLGPAETKQKILVVTQLPDCQLR